MKLPMLLNATVMKGSGVGAGGAGVASVSPKV